MLPKMPCRAGAGSLVRRGKHVTLPALGSRPRGVLRWTFVCSNSRRDVLAATVGIPGLVLLMGDARGAEKYEPMEALRGKDYGKPRMKFSDFTETASGLQYKDLREGAGDTPAEGSTCVVDWSGYTAGYYGRPFEARNKPKGSSFTGDNKDFLRFELGRHQVIPALEEAVAGMKVGGIRRVIVPVELGYPVNSRGLPDWRGPQGPRPSTFAGERALDFVLSNQGLIDKTLLLDVELIKVLP